MNNASGQLYVTATSEKDQFTIDNYSCKTFQDGETVPLADYFRIGGYFGSYGPHLFASAPQMFAFLESHARLVKDCGGVLPRAIQEHCARQIEKILKQAQGEQA